ncbi:hypothetical protein M123_4825 [Bacteroides fragilis str. 3976T8]|uniref:Uncharacterized protein n=1 Tax=Bacteroides fragilis str. 3976T8 TaxID=1339314 RepID=A0A016CWL4_BACFG|nr:hypothetical protein M123_4825 [Bacteroides fragilis str. 3976T8]
MRFSQRAQGANIPLLFPGYFCFPAGKRKYAACLKSGAVTGGRKPAGFYREGRDAIRRV